MGRTNIGIYIFTILMIIPTHLKDIEGTSVLARFLESLKKSFDFGELLEKVSIFQNTQVHTFHNTNSVTGQYQSIKLT